jgi:hypothetical protein
MITPSTALKLLEALRELSVSTGHSPLTRSEAIRELNLRQQIARTAIALAEQELAEQEMETDR